MAKARNINPAILKWARDSARLPLEEAAERIGFTSSDKLSAAEKLERIEAGDDYPTRNQLIKFASVYRRPLTTFYLKEPPRTGERGEDFRTLPASVSPRDNALLDSLLRDMRARQEMVRGLLEDEDEASAHPFVGSASLTDGVPGVAASIAETLGFDPLKRRAGNAGDLFRALRTRTEAIGVFVLLVADLGSHHSAISEKVFRGFAIADPIAPFVVLNDQDAKAARSFTLLHELAHIWLGQTGVSGTPESAEPTTQAERVERFCNDVASELLLPPAALPQRPANLTPGDKDRVVPLVDSIAAQWSVSQPMVAYRLHRLGWITPSLYSDLCSSYAARWYATKQREKEKNKEKEGGPTYYTMRQYSLGDALIDVVRRTLRGNALTDTKAAKMLRIKPGLVETLLRTVEKGRGPFPTITGDRFALSPRRERAHPRTRRLLRSRAGSAVLAVAVRHGRSRPDQNAP